MRHLFTIVAGLALMAPAMALAANSDSKTVGVAGNVANLCVLGAPTPAAVDVGQMAATSGARVGKITTIAGQNVTLPGSFCNFAGTHLTVSATALVAADGSAVQAGFARAVNYTATVNNWAGTAAAVTTTATAAGGTPTASGTGGNQAAPKLSDLGLVLSAFTAPSDNLLVAGGYSGSVTITLGPSVAE